jgi:glycosyltransferase involved in cell wall biosynthesis
MRLGIISTMGGAPWGGSEELWADTARLALRAGFRVSICLPFRPRPSHRKWEALEAAGAETFSYAIGRRYIRARKVARMVSTLHHDLGRQLGERLSPLRAFFSTRPDVLLISEGASIPALAVIESVRRHHIPKPYVILSESNLGEVPETTARRQAADFYRNAHWALFVSESNLRATERQLIERLAKARVVRNSTNLSCIDPVPWPVDRPFRLASIARLDASTKGQDILFEVFNDPRWRTRDWRLSLYGKGPDEVYFQELSAFYGLHNRVTFRGQTEDVREVWHTHHALVLPSRAEGTPLAMVEAMLCARPVIGTAVAGIPEWVRHGRSGFLADAPTVSSYAFALETAWQQRARWRTMGAHAREDALRLYDPTPERTLLSILTETVSTCQEVPPNMGQSARTSSYTT